MLGTGVDPTVRPQGRLDDEWVLPSFPALLLAEEQMTLARIETID